jgi:hypothetical protein
MQDSNVLIDDSSNISGVKSVTFTSSASNPGAGRTVWFNAGSATLCVGSNEIVDIATAQTLTNKTLTAPIISTISNTGTITLPTATTTLVGRDTTDTLTNKTMTGSTNLVDASALQTIGASVNVSLAAPPTVGKVLTATSASTATWQTPATPITTPGSTTVNRIILWGDTTGDTLTLASMKLVDTTFQNALDQNLITVGLGSGNTGVGLNTVANITTGISNVALGDSAGAALTSSSLKTACSISALSGLTTSGLNVCVGASSGGSYTAESGNILIGYNLSGTAGDSQVIRIGSSSHNNLYIGNRALYKSTGGNCSFGSVLASTGCKFWIWFGCTWGLDHWSK